MRANALLLTEYRPPDKSDFFWAIVKKCSVGEVNKEMRTAGCHVKKMLDIMALL